MTAQKGLSRSRRPQPAQKRPESTSGAPPAFRRQKYGATRVTVDGREFASKAEARRYRALRLAEQAGAIRDLECQVLYRFEINGTKVGRYTGDFRYVDAATGEVVVEDVKGFAARDWPLRKRLMLACHGIAVREVRA